MNKYYQHSRKGEENKASNYVIDKNKQSAQFYINASNRYNNSFPDFRKPCEVGSFSSTKRIEKLEKKSIKIENEGVKYLVLPDTFPNCKFDLNVGQSDFIPHVPHQNGLDSLLKWILENKSKFQLSSSQEDKINSLNTDFICWRGLLTKLLAVPYEKQSDFLFSVIYYKKTWYLCEHETEKQQFERLNENDQNKKFQYWGHKFETYVSSDEPNGETESSGTPDPDDNYSVVVRTRLQSHSLVYAAEVDCCFDKEHKSLDNYCEIKTSRGNSIADLNLTWSLKFMKWWLQSFLVDTKKLLVGMRDDNGIVNKLLNLNVSQIIQEAKNWNASVCFNFLQELLDFIKMYCRQEGCVYLFERQSGSSFINCKISYDRNHNFIRDWFDTQF